MPMVLFESHAFREALLVSRFERGDVLGVAVLQLLDSWDDDGLGGEVGMAAGATAGLGVVTRLQPAHLGAALTPSSAASAKHEAKGVGGSKPSTHAESLFAYEAGLPHVQLRPV